ncbi:MAG TPA: hypothetical protein VGL40_08650 [Bacillota bacterium]
MSDKGDHLTQAEHNEALASELTAVAPMKYKDWAVTVCFYAALHYVEAAVFPRHCDKEAAAAKKGKHTYRVGVVEKKWGKPAGKLYFRMRMASETARYLSNGGTPGGSFLSDAATLRFLNQDLKDLKAFLHV